MRQWLSNESVCILCRSGALGGHVLGVCRRQPVTDRYRARQGDLQGHRQSHTQWIRHGSRTRLPAHKQRTYRYRIHFHRQQYSLNCHGGLTVTYFLSSKLMRLFEDHLVCGINCLILFMSLLTLSRLLIPLISVHRQCRRYFHCQSVDFVLTASLFNLILTLTLTYPDILLSIT